MKTELILTVYEDYTFNYQLRLSIEFARLLNCQTHFLFLEHRPNVWNCNQDLKILIYKTKPELNVRSRQ